MYVGYLPADEHKLAVETFTLSCHSKLPYGHPFAETNHYSGVRILVEFFYDLDSQ
jgi:hypothetical protein